MAAPHPRKPDPSEKAAPKPKPWHVPTLATLSSDFRTLFINLCLLAILIVMVPVVGLQFMRSQVIIDAIAVPPSLMSRGLSADVAANRLWDGLHDAEAMAASSKEGITVLPKSQRVDFSIPDSGISIDSLVYYVRQFFHAYQTRVSGEFRCADADCAPDGMSLRIRILREKLDIIQMPPIGKETEDAYFREAALRILAVLDPFTAAAAQLGTNPDASLAAAERLVQTHSPDAIWAYNLIGNAKRNQGDIDGAIKAFRGALALDPTFVIASTNLGAALVAKGDFDGATNLFDSIARTNPDDKFLALGRYRLAKAQGKTDEAIKFALQADAIDPGKPTYLFFAAQTAFAAQRIAEATGYAQRALAVAPDDYGSVFLMASIDEIAGAFDKAEALLRSALALSPNQPDFAGLLADVLVQEHKFDAGLAMADKALALAPDTASIEVTRADALQSLGRQPEALTQLEAAAKLDPANARIALMQGQGQAALNHPADAIAAYQRAVALDATGANGTIAKMQIKLLGGSN